MYRLMFILINNEQPRIGSTILKFLILTLNLFSKTRRICEGEVLWKFNNLLDLFNKKSLNMAYNYIKI